MSNNYAQGTFEPLIPADLLTDSDKKLLEALEVSVDQAKEGFLYLYNENFATSARIINPEDGIVKEVGEDDLYKMFQEIIKRSDGKLPWVSHEQAYTNDKMRRSEFGGSAVFITADDIQWNSTSSWLERRIHEVESGDIGPDTDDTPTSPSATHEEIVDAARELITAAKLVVERWTSGDLAEAVNNLNMVTSFMEYTLETAEKPVAPQQPTTLAIVLEGGLVQAVTTDNLDAFKGINTVIIDYDTKSLDDEDDETLGLVLQGDGTTATAYIRATSIDQATVDLGQVADFVSDKAYGSNQQRIAACGGHPCVDCKDVCLDATARCVNEVKCLAWLHFNDN